MACETAVVGLRVVFVQGGLFRTKQHQAAPSNNRDSNSAVSAWSTEDTEKLLLTQ
jgi:hypothetical protein